MPNAPQQDLAKAYDPSSIESKWAAYWVEHNIFATPETQPGEAGFTMLLPPPNVTGRLHMGHMLNQAEMDILTRWHRMRGERALWLPGTDHAGIATQMMVEKQLAAEGTITRQDLGRDAFMEKVWTWKHQYGSAITDQMRRLGASVDWSREYFTMDDTLSHAVTEAFVRLYEGGLIYRGAYIVNWDPALQTAVSDLEVESEERLGKLYSVRYPLADGTGHITIATTRPETLLGDTAVAVNPQDARYRHLVGRQLSLPLTGRQIPIVADDYANPEFGTGAVKVTPAHDPNDFAIGQRQNLPSITILDKTAKIALPPEATGQNPEGDRARTRYEGLDRFAARELIVEHLEAAGLLAEVKEHPMAVPVSQRSGSVIEPRLSDQWFVKIQPLADKAIEAVRAGHIKFTPENYAKTYFEWMGNIHDWCISRQLWWGHRIPAWHCSDCRNFCVARVPPIHCPNCGSKSLIQDPDVLDTWFSSGLLPVTVFGWPQQGPQPTPDMASFYPTTLLVTGFDILFFWVARMIMLGVHFMLEVPLPDGSPRPLAEAIPFREVYIHGLVRDADKQKMSKTRGNVIDPIGIIERFGTDAVRFTLASMASPGTDIAFSEARTEGYRAFANKIWNAARFLFMNLDRAHEAGFTTHLGSLDIAPWERVPIETQWIYARLAETCATVDRTLAAYRFDEAANSIYQFFWGEFCDWYLELIKVRLNFSADRASVEYAVTSLTLNALLAVFDAALRLLSPFMPFLTEEIWHALYAKIGQSTPTKSIALFPYPQQQEFVRDTGTGAADMAHLQDIITTIRSIRKDLAVPEKEPAPIHIFSTHPAIAQLAVTHTDTLAKMARVTTAAVAGQPLTGPNTRTTPNFDLQVEYERQIDVPAERERLTKDLAKYEKGLQAAEKQLGNETFTAKAPAHIIEGLRKQQLETQLLYDKTKHALEQLS